MKLRDILDILSARMLVDHQSVDGEVPMGGAADLMSDVLAFGSEGMVFMTGLTNPQVIRTAEMAGINVVIFVRDKTPPPETLELAKRFRNKCFNHGIYHVRGVRPIGQSRVAWFGSGENPK